MDPKTKEFGKDRGALQLSIVNACYEIKITLNFMECGMKLNA